MEDAFLIHTRGYRETSVIVELFTKNCGKISAVAKGVRAPKSRLMPVLQPFIPLLVDWRGRGPLYSLAKAEQNGLQLGMTGDALLSAMYLNELLVRLLGKQDPHEALFSEYYAALIQLSQGADIQPVLRIFEKRLLTILGYELPLAELADQYRSGQFSYDVGVGFNHCEVSQSGSNVFTFDSLYAIHEETFLTSQQLNDAKRLMRIALRALLGDKPLRSRELFIKV